MQYRRHRVNPATSSPCPFCLIFSRTGMQKCRFMWWGEGGAFLNASSVGKSLHFFPPNLNMCGETKAMSAERWQTKNYWKFCGSAPEVPSNIALIFAYVFESCGKKKQNFYIIPHQILPKDNKTCQLLTTGCIFYNWHRNEKELENIPKKIIHPDDILLICVLGINSYGGTRLYPNISSILLHPTIVLRHTLALIQHWGEKTKQTEGIVY